MKAGTFGRMNMVPMHISIFLFLMGFFYDHLHYYNSQLETLISKEICKLVLKNLNTDLDERKCSFSKGDIIGTC